MELYCKDLDLVHKYIIDDQTGEVLKSEYMKSCDNRIPGEPLICSLDKPSPDVKSLDDFLEIVGRANKDQKIIDGTLVCILTKRSHGTPLQQAIDFVLYGLKPVRRSSIIIGADFWARMMPELFPLYEVSLRFSMQSGLTLAVSENGDSYKPISINDIERFGPVLEDSDFYGIFDLNALGKPYSLKTRLKILSERPGLEDFVKYNLLDFGVYLARKGRLTEPGPLHEQLGLSKQATKFFISFPRCENETMYGLRCVLYDILRWFGNDIANNILEDVRALVPPDKMIQVLSQIRLKNSVEREDWMAIIKEKTSC